MDLKRNIRDEVAAISPVMLQQVMRNFQKRLRECVDKGHHLTDTIFRKWILQLKCSETKIILVINSRKKTVYFSFYFNLKIVRFFCQTLYITCSLGMKECQRKINWKGHGRKWLWGDLRHHHYMCMWRNWEKFRKNLNQNNWSLDQDLNLQLPQEKAHLTWNFTLSYKQM